MGACKVTWMSVLVCRVEARFPVAVVTLYGTLDTTTVVEAMVTLRGCLAEQPVQLVLDAGHLRVSTAEAARPLTDLAGTARRWPGARIAVSAAPPDVREILAGLAPEGELDFYPDAGQAMAAGRRIPVPPGEAVPLAPDRNAPARGRAAVARICDQWRLRRWSWLAQLLASELVTNAVVHARTPAVLLLRHPEGVLRVAVRDGDPRLVARPVDGTPDRDAADDPGRGLLLLTTLADDWGCAPTGDGKVTWADVRVPG